MRILQINHHIYIDHIFYNKTLLVVGCDILLLCLTKVRDVKVFFFIHRDTFLNKLYASFKSS